MNPFSPINQGWVTPQVVTNTTLGVQIQPRTVAPNIIGFRWVARRPAALQTRLKGCTLSKCLTASLSPFSTKPSTPRGCSSGTMTAVSNNKPANAPARYRIGVLEYDYRDGTSELALNLNRGEPTDPWSDTALGITPHTTPNTDRKTPLVAGGPRGTGWYLLIFRPSATQCHWTSCNRPMFRTRSAWIGQRWLDQPVIAGTVPADI